MNRLFLWMILLFQSVMIYGQGLKGIVCDDLNGYGIEKATVTVMRTRDSLLVAYDRTWSNGSFLFDKLKPDHYDIFISYPDYLGYATDVEITPGNIHNMDTIRLIKNSQMLNEITIVDGSKIKFKGDTIQFIADSFKVGSNANVEDLLKKMSGIQVNSKGEITAFGEKVEKVFVDGEEFFGSDPTIATRNIQAKAVDKVQVFDKTSKQEELTGIPDDERFKAINLTLKEEYKKGYFGKAKAGIGAKPLYYDESLMFQAYTKKTKVSAYGIASNTGTTGLDFDDMNRYMGGFSGGNMMFDGNSVMITMTSDGDDDISWDGRYNGIGLPKSLSGGASVSTKLAKDKIKLSGSYGYSDLRLNKELSDNTTNFLPERSYIQENRESSINRKITHSGKLKFEMDIDSFTTLSIMASASIKDYDNSKVAHSRQIGLDSTAITTVDRELTSKKQVNAINSNVSLTRKFRKKGRFLSVNGSYNLSESNGTVSLISENKYYSQNIFQDLNQIQDVDSKSNSYNGNITFSEPINDKWTSQVNFYSSHSGNLSDRITNELDEETNQYDRYIDSLSNDYNYRIATNGGGLAFNFKNEKYNFRLGTNADYAVTLRENKIDTSRVFNSTFRWLPSANFNYKFNRTSNLRFRYSGSTNQPTIDQIQPVRDNSDPTVLIKGNPDLKQSYRQSFNLTYNMWQSLSDFSIWSFANFDNTFNDIVLNTYIDESRRSISTYTNVNGGYGGYMGVNLNYKLSSNFSLRTGIDLNTRKRISFVNGLKTDVLNYGISPEIGAMLDIDEKFSWDFRYSPSFNRSKGNLISGAGNYYSHNVNSSFRYHIFKNLEIYSDLEWSYQGAESSFSQSFSQVLWNAKTEWTIDKAKNFVLQLAINDILNQNKGYSRVVNTYSTRESRNNTIQRYGLLSLIYNIKSKGK